MNFNFLIMNCYSFAFDSSPDGSGILFLFSLKRKRYSGQQEIAPNFI